MRTPASLLLRIACAMGLYFMLGTARADIYVIAHVNASTEQLSQQQVADLYLGRTRMLQPGDYVILLDQSNDQPVRERFFRLIANMSLSQVNAYWARLSFTGRQHPPQPKANDAKVIEAVSRDPLAIGYVGTQPGSQVRVILHLHE